MAVRLEKEKRASLYLLLVPTHRGLRIARRSWNEQRRSPHVYMNGNAKDATLSCYILVVTVHTTGIYRCLLSTSPKKVAKFLCVKEVKRLINAFPQCHAPRPLPQTRASVGSHRKIKYLFYNSQKYDSFLSNYCIGRGK